MADRVLVLLSGGIDSLVTAERLRRNGTLGACLFVDYGHPAQQVEGAHAFIYARRHRIRMPAPHVRDIVLGDMKGAGHAARVVPGRNMILIATAANWCGELGCNSIALGCNQADQRDYPDCSPQFLVRAQAAVSPYGVFAPLLGLSKAQIIAEAVSYGFTREDAWACYGPGPGPCGECPSCVEADKAWGAVSG